MSAQFDELLGHATSCYTLTDDELADLRQEITRDVVTELMFGPQQPDRQIRRAGKVNRADVYLISLSCKLLGSDSIHTHLERLVDDLTDIEGALHFACLVNLAQEPEEAIWWWQFAGGAGNATAAYCLYLLHLSRGELRDAEHWMSQALAPDNRIDFFPPPSCAHQLPASLSTNLREAVQRLKVVDASGIRLHHPDHRFLEQIGNHLGPKGSKGSRESTRHSPADLSRQRRLW
ncbi:hypothetical protein SAMN05216489_00018 [Streptomyces sp. 3213]|uniref:hypothetical protein n=1 Tax=Streptomyces sp. 3213.3 TaxID=1855348 RepID=UPI000899F59E|nr:hypothetical protein [Streptomyces sp. 3213.3]SEC15217.1 hypothetical protein SAMN05216489_00018 [Streptomyces sp. 3213] [Streptomyces sp. 3213.3]